MMLEYIPEYDPSITKALDDLNWSAFFYPSFADYTPVLYGLGISLCKNDRKDIMRSGIFDILNFVSSRIFLFKTNLFCCFKPVVSRPLEPFLIREGKLLFSGQEGRRIDGWKILEKKDNEITSGISPIDQFTGRFNPLKHLVFMDKKLPNDEKSTLLTAIDLGYPYRSSAELHRTEDTPAFLSLRSATAHFFEINTLIFSKIAEVLVVNSLVGKNCIPSTNSILLLLESSSLKSIKLIPDSMPRIYIESLRADCIMWFKNVNDLESFVERLYKFKENFNLEEVEITTLDLEKSNFSNAQEKESSAYIRYRIMITSHFSNQCSLPVQYVPDYFEELESFVVENVLKTTDETSYRMFVGKDKKKKEFWIKSARVILVLPSKFIQTATKVIVEHFLDSLHLSFGCQAIAIREFEKRLVELVFDIDFQRSTDFFVSGRQHGLFFDKTDKLDRWTATGAECAMMKDFKKAEEYLERARTVLDADLSVLSSCSGGKTENKTQLREAAENYRRVGIVCPIYPTEPMYTGGNLEEVEKAIRKNLKWRRSLSLYLEGIEMKENILEGHFSGRSRSKELRKARKLIRESKLFPMRDSIAFENELSTFYAKLLSAIQQEYGDYTPEWLGFVH